MKIISSFPLTISLAFPKREEVNCCNELDCSFAEGYVRVKGIAAVVVTSGGFHDNPVDKAYSHFPDKQLVIRLKFNL